MATNKFNFTKAALQAIKPPESGLLFVYDTAAPGLALCITPNDARTYYRCGRVDGRYQRIKIGDYGRFKIDQARNAAKRISADVADGKAINIGAKTLGDLHAWYMAHHSIPHKKTASYDQATFNNHLSHWRKRKLRAIGRQDVQGLVTHIAANVGKGAASNVLTLLKHMLKKGIENGWIVTNAADGVKRYARNQRERFLSADELRVFFEAVNSLKLAVSRDFFYLALLTGARRSNVLAMRWDDIHFDRAIWLIPASQFKNKKAQGIPLSPEAMQILQRRLGEREGDCPWVLPGRSRDGHYNDPKDSWRSIIKASGLKNLVIHDLRRTLGSWQAATGASLPIIGKTLGHQSPSSTQIYARLDLDPVRQAVNTATTAMMQAASKKKSENDQNGPGAD